MRAETARKIRELNDAFRTTMTGGRMVMTAGVNALASDVKAMVIRRGRSSFGKSTTTTPRHAFRLVRSGRPGQDHACADHHARERVLMVAYFIRRTGDVCAVIKLHADNSEEIAQDGLSPIEAEILCMAKMVDIPRATAQQTDAPVKAKQTRPRLARQLSLKL